MQDERVRNKVRRGLMRYMERKGAPRVILSLVIVVTGLAGFLLSFVLLRLGLESMGVRYPLAVLGAYGIFLGLMRVWVEYERAHMNLEDPELIEEMAKPDMPEVPRIIDGQKRSWLDYIALPDLGDDALVSLAFWLFMALLGLVVVVITIIGGAPILIAEVLVDTVLAGLLYQRLRIPATEHWLGGAIRKTWVHLILCMLLLGVSGFCLDFLFAGADTVGQAVRIMMGDEGAVER